MMHFTENYKSNFLHAGKVFHEFCRLPIFSKLTFLKNSFGNTIRVSKSLDQDQARHCVGPDLGQTVCKRDQQTTKDHW